MCRLHRLGGDVVAVRQLVLLRAGAFTLFATDAHRRVIQQGLTHGNCSSLLPSETSIPVECTKYECALTEQIWEPYKTPLAIRLQKNNRVRRGTFPDPEGTALSGKANGGNAFG